jgi:hypothetical protein
MTNPALHAVWLSAGVIGTVPDGAFKVYILLLDGIEIELLEIV